MDHREGDDNASDSYYNFRAICKRNNQPTKHVVLQWQRAMQHIQSADNEWRAKRLHNPQPRITTRTASGGGQSQTRSPTYFQATTQPATRRTKHAAGRLAAVSSGRVSVTSITAPWDGVSGRSVESRSSDIINLAGRLQRRPVGRYSGPIVPVPARATCREW